MRQKHRQNIVPTLNNNTVVNNENIINIQLNYDINHATDQKSWDSKFRVIYLHRLIEHLVSDIKNIKGSLHRMQKYILGKVIDSDKANDIKDLKSIGKVA